jgi:hypothetical protein
MSVLTGLALAAAQLTEALTAENAALLALDLGAAAALLERKQAAAAAFTEARKKGPPPPRLRPVAERLRDLADENRRLLERAIAVQTRVLGLLAGAARANNPAPRYGRSGAYAPPVNAGWALSSKA